MKVYARVFYACAGRSKNGVTLRVLYANGTGTSCRGGGGGSVRRRRYEQRYNKNALPLSSPTRTIKQAGLRACQRRTGMVAWTRPEDGWVLRLGQKKVVQFIISEESEKGLQDPLELSPVDPTLGAAMVHCPGGPLEGPFSRGCPNRDPSRVHFRPRQTTNSNVDKSTPGPDRGISRSAEAT